MAVRRFLASAFGIGAVLAVVGAIAAAALYGYYARSLPDHRQLADYQPPVTTRVYVGDGSLLAEYATEKRVFVPISEVPRQLIQAFLSAEDKSFYTHHGIDVPGIARAIVTNVENWGTNRRPVGASTITQQVAKNFLVGNELSIERKVREAILAYRIDQTFTKDRILELYLNEIYLGRGAYGVGAAALSYFNKDLNELTLAEQAFLAALPKAPANYDPDRAHAAALARRNWVIGRMLEDGTIDRQTAEEAMADPLVTSRRRPTDLVQAGYFAEEVRRDLQKQFGEDALYKGGLTVHSTLDPRLQEIADRSLRDGLEAYDRRHGWRGPVARISVSGNWQKALAAVPPPPGLNGWRLAVVLSSDRRGAAIGFDDGSRGRITPPLMAWSRRSLSAGDVVVVGSDEKASAGVYALKQIPAVDGALVALDPHTGRVLALAGGWSHERSVFNRATQAQRQPGSAFKPFVYLAAFEDGYSPVSIVQDAPISFDQGPGLPDWSPHNYSERYYGPTTLRVGLEQSRNVMTVRLANQVGMEHVVDVAKRFGVTDGFPPHLAYALGAGDTTLLRLTAAYGMLVNGGRELTPSLIDRIQDRYGHTIYRLDQRTCSDCTGVEWHDQPMPDPPSVAAAVTDPYSAYQVVSILEGVVQRGTGRIVAAVDKPLAGKTGTSNDAKDTWFIGFSPNLVVGVFVGFDEPESLGNREAGGTVAAPIFRDFMAAALADEPGIPFRIPSGMQLVRMDPRTGRPASGGDAIWEAFKPGTDPYTAQARVRDRDPAPGPAVGTGGLY